MEDHRLKWERLDSNSLKRAKVPGGWLVVYSDMQGSGITFVPDADHAWQVHYEHGALSWVCAPCPPDCPSH